MRELGYGKGYQYAHAQPDQAVSHEHLPDELSGRRYYEPADNPVERAVSERLETDSAATELSAPRFLAGPREFRYTQESARRRMGL